MRHADTGKGPAAIIRSIEAGVEHVTFFSIFWIGVDARVVPGPLPQIPLLIRLGPGAAAVVRAKDAAVLSLDNGPQAIRIRRRDGNTYYADRAPRQTGIASDLSPVIAAVSRFEDAAARPAALERPRLAINFPEARI